MGELEPKDILETGFKALFGPVQDIFLKLTGPAAEEYGLMWADSVKLRRTKRLVKGLAKTKQMLQDAGFEPDVVPDKLLLPMFEGMCMEDDEDLRTMWAALLANASIRESVEVRLSYSEILAQLSPAEAKLLDQIQLHVDRNLTKHYPSFPNTSNWAYLVHVGTWKTVLQSYAKVIEVDPSVLLNSANTSSDANKVRSNFRVSFENLIRLGLLREDKVKSQSRPVVLLTALGYDFVLACRPPEPKN